MEDSCEKDRCCHNVLHITIPRLHHDLTARAGIQICQQQHPAVMTFRRVNKSPGLFQESACAMLKRSESGSQDLRSHAGPPCQKVQHAQKRFLFTWNCTNQYQDNTKKKYHLLITEKNETTRTESRSALKTVSGMCWLRYREQIRSHIAYTQHWYLRREKKEAAQTAQSQVTFILLAEVKILDTKHHY